MTSAQLSSLISAKVKGKGNKANALTFMNKRKDMLYLEAALKPFLLTQKPGGVKLQIGRGSEVLNVAVYYYVSAVDTAEAMVHCGTVFGKCKCRHCLANCSSVGLMRTLPMVYRNPAATKLAQKQGQESFIRKVCTHGRRISVQDTQCLKNNKNTSVANTIVPLHDHFDKQFAGFPAMNVFR